MKRRQGRLPHWATASRKLLRDAKPLLGVIRREGTAEIRRGLQKVKKADELEADIDYLVILIDQEHPQEVWEDEIVNTTGMFLPGRLQAFTEQLGEIAEDVTTAGVVGAESQTRFLRAVSDSDGTSSSAVLLGGVINRRFLVIDPDRTPAASLTELERLSDRASLYTELKALLEMHAPSLVVKLAGSESALASGSPDSSSQAMYSARDLFDGVLNLLAPAEAVKAQGWFVPTKRAPKEVSRRAKLRYIVSGSADALGEVTLNELEALTDTALSILDLCIARAHNSDIELTSDEVRLTIDQIRNALRQVLRHYERRTAK